MCECAIVCMAANGDDGSPAATRQFIRMKKRAHLHTTTLLSTESERTRARTPRFKRTTIHTKMNGVNI